MLLVAAFAFGFAATAATGSQAVGNLVTVGVGFTLLFLGYLIDRIE
jgi:hypothetical protein